MRSLTLISKLYTFMYVCMYVFVMRSLTLISKYFITCV